MSRGVVYLVGAGPGNEGLITAEGLRLLRAADAVIYDRLVCQSLLRHVRPEAERHYAGFRSRKDPRRQSRINQLMVRLARRGLNVVRLKGGDPLIFARGAEEAEHLRKKRIPFEFIAAPTAGCAAAYAGIPLTDRRISSKVTFLTARQASQKRAVPVEDLPRDGTLVIYMGLDALREIAGKLLKAGWDRRLPAVVIEWASTGRQRVVEGRLGTIADKAEKARVRTPAMTIVGKVAAMRRRLSWWEKKPLFGHRIAVTRPEDRGFADELIQRGADVVYLPSTRLEPVRRPKGMSAALRTLKDFDTLMFSSRTAVRLFFEHLFEAGLDARSLSHLQVCAIGPGTEEELRDEGVRADFRPPKATTGSFSRILARRIRKGDQVLYPCADKRNPAVAKRLRAAGARVTEIILYRIRPVRPEGIERLWPASILTFTSAETARSFLRALPKKLAAKVRGESRIACIGPVTARAVRESGFRPAAVAERHDMKGLLRAVLALARGKR